ncbi:hypothetical protein PZH42_29780, partial [Bacteroides cellulosilyticus]|nr:hypothetical protein [Bacteroides cellulosilyticus]
SIPTIYAGGDIVRGGASVRAKALYFRELCRQNGWEIPAEVPSNCITGFFVRQNGDILFNELLKQDIFIMPGGTPCYFRVSHQQRHSEIEYQRQCASCRH